jgi:hypothetical protein
MATLTYAEALMDDRTIEGLVARMGRLERQNRRLKRFGGAALIGLLVAMIIGANIDVDTITCKFLTINGSDGKPRIQFFGGNSDQANGRVTMIILDPTGRPACETYWEPRGQTGRFVVYKNDGSGQDFMSIPPP